MTDTLEQAEQAFEIEEQKSKRIETVLEDLIAEDAVFCESVPMRGMIEQRVEELYGKELSATEQNKLAGDVEEAACERVKELIEDIEGEAHGAVEVALDKIKEGDAEIDENEVAYLQNKAVLDYVVQAEKEAGFSGFIGDGEIEARTYSEKEIDEMVAEARDVAETYDRISQ